MGALSIWHLVILLVVVVVIFGTGKLRNAGSDLGKAVKGFKDGMKDSDETSVNRTVPPQQVPDKSTIDVETREKTRY